MLALWIYEEYRRGKTETESKYEGGTIMLFCCHKYFSETEKRYLLDNEKHHNRVLEFGTCPICNTLKAILTYKDAQGKLKEHKPKKKKAKQFINDCLTQPYFEIKDLKERFGSKNNMFWLFQTNGTIKDFNNTVKGNCKSDITFITIQDTASIMGAFL